MKKLIVTLSMIALLMGCSSNKEYNKTYDTMNNNIISLGDNLKNNDTKTMDKIETIENDLSKLNDQANSDKQKLYIGAMKQDISFIKDGFNDGDSDFYLQFYNSLINDMKTLKKVSE
ncbi:hypothetical protein [Bacillus sp. AFS017336]|uniref:hypothetical protein n=1 Tax=Bacillus sp. AFS017336 TaxID=2033489 RepID=UPI000BF1F813|nr:hypothetical protein [Bacillus sp. AFS017336]PEL13771.1 hypothetical protein CN601_03400 [Bacillus sp. AFS017336]